MRRSACFLICYERLCFLPPVSFTSLLMFLFFFPFLRRLLPPESSATESSLHCFGCSRCNLEECVKSLGFFWIIRREECLKIINILNLLMTAWNSQVIGWCKRAAVENAPLPTWTRLNSTERQVSAWCFEYWLWKFLPFSSGTNRLCSSESLIIFFSPSGDARSFPS